MASSGSAGASTAPKGASRRGQGSASPGAAGRRTAAAKAKPKGKAAASPVDRSRGAGEVPRHLAARASWSPEEASLKGARVAAVPAEGDCQDISALVARLADGEAALGGLCAGLERGGHDAIDVAVEHGAVERTVALLNGAAGGAGQDLGVVRRATEALWWLAADFDQTQLLIRAGGNDAVLRLAREHGPQDPALAANSFRLLANTLYCEARNSDVFRQTDFGFMAEALRWAFKHNSPEMEHDGHLLSSVCDVAALWLQRATVSGGGEDAAKGLVSIIPVLLERMAARTDDTVLLQNGCRLLYTLARSCSSWPEDLRQPAIAALMQLGTMLQFSPCFEARAYSGLAFQAVSNLPAGGLSQMD